MLHRKVFNPGIAIFSALVLNVLNISTISAGNAPKRYIVILKDNVDPDTTAIQHAHKHLLPEVSHTYRHVFKGYAARIPESRLASLKADPRVESIIEDVEVKAFGQVLPTGVKRISGNISSTKSGDGTGTVNTAIAVIDTGIQTNHPDLNVVGGTDCVSNIGYNDLHGHGTHVAGIIAAKDDGNGVVGVAPGAPLYAVRVLDASGSGSTSTVLCGIEWVTANAAAKGIKVANLSLGGVGYDDGKCGLINGDPQHKAICKSIAAGVTYVVAAGNNNVDFQKTAPAAYKEVLTVTAIADFNGNPGGGAAPTCRSDVDDTAADFSNYTSVGNQNTNHTIAAPGTCINSTWIGSGYATLSGTSMAAPHVAGTVALCIAASKCANMTPQQIIAKLRNDAAAQPQSYGFKDSPNSPNGTRYYGNLVFTANY